MRITQSYKKWFFLPFIFLAVLYACTSEQDYQTDTDKPVEPLTVSTAQSLYEQYIGRSSKLKSSSEGFSPELIPDWDKGQLFSDSNWYVVESPMETEQGQYLRFALPEVEEYSEINNIRPGQILRQVIMRNKHTGLDYAFMMVVIPDLDYMLRKGDKLKDSKYLARESDLSGAVLFYGTNGLFVNGWVYKEGEITYSIGKVSGGGLKSLHTIEYCWNQLGGDPHSSTVIRYCEVSYSYIPDINNRDVTLIEFEPGGGGRIDSDYLPVGGGGGLAAPSSGNKSPGKRDDCSGSATMNANNAQDAMTATTDIINMKQDAVSATQKDETGTRIDYVNGKYTNTNYSGIGYYIDIPISQNTVYTAHTHLSGNFGAPSSVDIQNFLHNQYYVPNLKGIVTVSHDGREYMLVVNDPQMAREAYELRRDYWSTGADTFFSNEKMLKLYFESSEKLGAKGFSQEDIYTYTMSAALDYFKTGLKLYVKEKNSTFKETKTEMTNSEVTKSDYKPTICP